MENKIIPDREIKELDEVGKIAKFFGFIPFKPPMVEKKDFENTRDIDRTLCPSEKAALLRMYIEEKMSSMLQPRMFYFEKPFPSFKESNEKKYKKTSRLESSLVTIGSSKSVCECLSIQAGLSMLNYLGYKNLEVEVNSIGDKESLLEFQRKLTTFVRKNFNDFPANLRQATKRNVLAIFKEEECQNLQIECPKPIDFLSEPSRGHFKEVIEFLEIMEIPYKINNNLISDLNIGSETIFSIKKDNERLAFGFRFNRLAKRIGGKKDLSATTLDISVKIKKNLKKVKAKPTKPYFYLIQFGPEAKLKSFLILRELYKAGINVIHSIARDKLGSQMGMAENSGIPYIILIGQKEALEDSVVVRNTITRAQEVIPIHDFSSRIKNLISEHLV